MDYHSSSSVESLRLKSEHSRARLKQTISQFSQSLSETGDDIKTTLSPDHLKEEARAYARKKQASVVRAVRRNITNHPLEALAIGAVVAYPLLGLLRKVPVPLALIGAGLLLSRKGNGASASQSNSLPEDEGQNRDEEGVGERLRAGFKEAQASVASASANAAEKLAEMAGSTASELHSKTQSFAASATKVGKETGDSLASLVERNPLLAGGAAIAIGGFIAASLPASRIEERVFGKGGDVLKQSARKAADGVVRGAKAEAATLADDISVAARDVGLTAEALDQTVDAVGDKVASVVDRAVDAAIGNKIPKAETDGDENARL